MSHGKVIVEKKEHIAKITLNRPEVLNCLDKDLLLELETSIDTIARDETIRVVIITGKGRAFSAGADLRYLKKNMRDAKNFQEFLCLVQRVFSTIENLNKPVLAAVNGIALAGGLELVLACDLAIASEDARLGDQHAVWGLLAGGGATQRLPRIVGIRKAKELIFTGDWLSAKEAERIGLVNQTVPADKFEEAVNQLAHKLASRSPLASKAAKMLINKASLAALDTGLLLEIEACARHVTTKDVQEGLRAFEEARKPIFEGK